MNRLDNSISFPHSAWECSFGRSSSPNDRATLEQRDLLPRWSGRPKDHLTKGILTITRP
jgi:hypothetical protein